MATTLRRPSLEYGCEPVVKRPRLEDVGLVEEFMCSLGNPRHFAQNNSQQNHMKFGQTPVLKGISHLFEQDPSALSGWSLPALNNSKEFPKPVDPSNTQEPKCSKPPCMHPSPILLYNPLSHHSSGTPNSPTRTASPPMIQTQVTIPAFTNATPAEVVAPRKEKEIVKRPPGSAPTSPPLTAQATTTNNTTTSNAPAPFFVLLEQPNEIQRKAYRKENRYILPNPLTVSARDIKHTKIASGSVTLTLVDEEGHDLPTWKQKLLQGELHHNLNSDLQAYFCVKIVGTSEGEMFRLRFVTNYTTEEGTAVEERITSRPFIVYSNKKRTIKENPTIIDVRPHKGKHDQETEVWIKGRGFASNVVVMFGDKPGRILDVNESLITASAPPRYDLPNGGTVQVTVSNKYTQALMESEKKLFFNYINKNGNRPQQQ